MVMWKAFITGSVTEHFLCSITAKSYYYCADLPENLIRLAFAFNPVLIWKLKGKKVNQVAKTTQLISSRAKAQSQVCVAPEPVLFPLSPAEMAARWCQFMVVKDLSSDLQGALLLAFGNCTCQFSVHCKRLAVLALLPNGSVPPAQPRERPHLFPSGPWKW